MQEFIIEMAQKVGYEVLLIKENLVRLVSREPAPYFEGIVEQAGYYLVRLSR